MSEPSEMVQRVAESLRAECRKQFGTDWSYDYAWAFARAAIEAMREPTEAMKVIDGSNRWDWNCGVCGGPRENWRLMIDAALSAPHKEGKAEP